MNGSGKKLRLLPNYQIHLSTALSHKLQGSRRRFSRLPAEQNELRRVSSPIGEVWKINPRSRRRHAFISRWSRGDEQVVPFVISGANSDNSDRRIAAQPQHSPEGRQQRFDPRYLVQIQRSLSITWNGKGPDQTCAS